MFGIDGLFGRPTDVRTLYGRRIPARTCCRMPRVRFGLVFLVLMAIWSIGFVIWMTVRSAKSGSLEHYFRESTNSFLSGIVGGYCPLLGCDPPALIKFVHVPKAGGTGLTTYLREIVGCKPRGNCCIPPGVPVGFCSELRTCDRVIGCMGHSTVVDESDFENKEVRTVINLRHPVSRLVSSWHYPGHHREGADFFEFSTRSYLYRDVMTRMVLGYGLTDRLWGPTRPQHVRDIAFAVERLHKYDLVAIQEAPKATRAVLRYRFPGGQVTDFEYERPRENTDESYSGIQARLLQARQQPGFDPQADAIIASVEQANAFDILLYSNATSILCNHLAAIPYAINDDIAQEILALPLRTTECDRLLFNWKSKGFLAEYRLFL